MTEDLVQWFKVTMVMVFILTVVNLVQLGKLENIREQLKNIMKHYDIKDDH
jgi:hypothetical protein